jgi:hypothetical protein
VAGLDLIALQVLHVLLKTQVGTAEVRILVDGDRYPTVKADGRDLPEPLLAKGSIESAGIECCLADDNMV